MAHEQSSREIVMTKRGDAWYPSEKPKWLAAGLGVIGGLSSYATAYFACATVYPFITPEIKNPWEIGAMAACPGYLTYKLSNLTLKSAWQQNPRMTTIFAVAGAAAIPVYNGVRHAMPAITELTK